MRRFLVGRSTGPVGPSTRAREKPMAAWSKSMSDQRMARSWLRRAPVVDRQMKVGEEARCRRRRTTSRSRRTCSTDGRSDVGRLDPRRRGVSGGVEPDPLPAHRLGQGPMQHDVNPVHGAGVRGRPSRPPRRSRWA